MKRKQEDWNQTQDTFRVFSKDDEGCIPADEMKFVLKHLPGKVCGLVWGEGAIVYVSPSYKQCNVVFKVTYKEIDEMIETVDKNGDGKISFSEFRWILSTDAKP